ncbi:protein Ltv1p [Diutina catenulata]
MPKKFDKKSAKTFELLHRSHDDAHFFDEEATSHVLVEKTGKKGKIGRSAVVTKSELDQELANAISANEGQAAQYGIMFDDSKYNYMQHLKPIGEGDMFIEAQSDKKKKELDLDELFDDSQLPQEAQRPRGFVPRTDVYESIPLELRGFQPDMDPRLREVLEALEDEEYVEEEAGDMFDDLLDGGEADEDDFDPDYDEYDYEDDEYDYDAQYANYTEPADHQALYNPGEAPEDFDAPYNPGEAPEDVAAPAMDWSDFAKFKKETKNETNDFDSDDDFEDEEEDAVGDLPNIAGKKNKTKQRKKKGAMTDTSSFSMSSSALFRTEGLALLDDRFEKIAKDYDAPEKEEDYQEFKMENERGDLEDLLDDFLDNFELEAGGRRLVKKDDETQRIQKAAQQATKSTKKKKPQGLASSFSGLSL